MFRFDSPVSFGLRLLMRRRSVQSSPRLATALSSNRLS
jgi:hypothetical protein